MLEEQSCLGCNQVVPKTATGYCAFCANGGDLNIAAIQDNIRRGTPGPGAVPGGTWKPTGRWNAPPNRNPGGPRMTPAICRRHGCGHYRELHAVGRCLAGATDDEDDACQCWGWSP